MNDTEWMDIRQDAYDCIHNPLKEILSKWCKECNITQIAYDIYLSNKKVIIYTDKPGIMIGYHGVMVDKYQKILQEEYGKDFKVEFKEIKGKFLYLEKENANGYND